MNTYKLKELLKNKWVIIIVVFVLILVIVLFSNSRKSANNQSNKNPNTFIPIPSSTTSPVNSAALQKAIADQKTADREYENWQDSKKATNPWNDELPLYGKNYYVYFDLNKKVFIGKLYPKVTDNVNDIKTEITRQLREEIDVPADSLKFEWTLMPK